MKVSPTSNYSELHRERRGLSLSQGFIILAGVYHSRRGLSLSQGLITLSGVAELRINYSNSLQTENK